MNAEPHSHQLDVYDRGGFWGIWYGDQHDVPDKPPRWFWFWEGRAAYTRRCERALRRHIYKVVSRHDRESHRVVEDPQEAHITFRPDQWASEQLT